MWQTTEDWRTIEKTCSQLRKNNLKVRMFSSFQFRVIQFYSKDDIKDRIIITLINIYNTIVYIID